MLLTKTISNSISAINERRKAEERSHSAETYLKALSKLSVVKKAIDSSLECAEILNKTGIVSEPVVTEKLRDELLDQANNCGRSISEGELSIDMVELLRIKGENLSQHIDTIWKLESKAYAGEVIGYLSLVGDFSDNPRKSRDIIDQVRRLETSNASKTAAQQLVSDVNEARKITEDFTLTPNIESFLKKVSSQQATVLDLTPEVMEWVKSKKIQGKLKIRV